MNDTHDLIDRTLQVWQPRIGRNLSREVARQIGENTTGFFKVLAGWSRAEKPSAPEDAGKSAGFDDEEGATLLRLTAQSAEPEGAQ